MEFEWIEEELRKLVQKATGKSINCELGDYITECYVEIEDGIQRSLEDSVMYESDRMGR